jgi:hypothetical protein
MPRALFGFTGTDLPIDLIVGRLKALEARVGELERDLAVIREELALLKEAESGSARLSELLTAADDPLGGVRLSPPARDGSSAGTCA